MEGWLAALQQDTAYPPTQQPSLSITITAPWPCNKRHNHTVYCGAEAAAAIELLGHFCPGMHSFLKGQSEHALLKRCRHRCVLS